MMIEQAVLKIDRSAYKNQSFSSIISSSNSEERSSWSHHLSLSPKLRDEAKGDCFGRTSERFPPSLIAYFATAYFVQCAVRWYALLFSVQPRFGSLAPQRPRHHLFGAKWQVSVSSEAPKLYWYTSQLAVGWCSLGTWPLQLRLWRWVISDVGNPPLAFQSSFSGFISL